MNKLYVGDYNFEKTLLGGQAFNWDFEDGKYYGVTQDRLIVIIPEGESIYWQTYPSQNDNDFIQNYLLGRKRYYDVMVEDLRNDKYFNLAFKANPYINLLDQDFEHTLLSFIASSNNSIKSIKTRLLHLRPLYGEKISIDGKTRYLFPKTEVLASLNDDKIQNLKLGYRGEYVVNTAKTLISDSRYKNIENLKEDQARSLLMELDGVGPKVADCVLTFGLGFNNIFPVDVWGKRILVDLYDQDLNTKYDELSNWTKEYFKGYASIASQYLFEWYRLNNVRY